MRANLARRVATFFGVVGILTAVAATGAPALTAAPLGPAHAAKAPAGVDTCGYADATFNESDILYGTAIYGSGASATVGISGAPGLRLTVVTASARSLPARTCDIAAGMLTMRSGTWPPSVSARAGPPPL